MQIAAFDIVPVVVPMPPHRTAAAVITTSPLVLLTVRTDEGVEGHAVLFTYTEAALRPLADLARNLAALVIGQPLAPADVTDGLHARLRLLGTHGLVGMAIAGIDMALWDALARAQRLPLCRRLGGSPRPVRAYGGIGHDGEQGSAEAAEAWARRGLRGIKAKIGYPTVAEDVAVVRAMRTAAGPGVEIMVDYNQSLSPTEAALRLRVLDDEGLAWIEEPVTAHDHAALARLAEGTRTPLQAGENWWGPLEFRQAIEAGVRDHLMPDVMKCGGVTGWMRIAALAQAHGIPVSNHLWPEISAQLLAATPTAHRLEYTDWWNPVLQAQLRLEGGDAWPDDAPGSGIAFDPDAVARFRV